MNKSMSNDELLEETSQLRLRLEESEAIVEAIRNGIVDAVVVSSTPGDSVYTLEGADRPYRLLVEAMQQGVAVLSPLGVVLYCNPCLSDLFRTSLEMLTGSTLDHFVVEADRDLLKSLLQSVDERQTQVNIRLRRQDGTTFPASLSLSLLPLRKLCLLVTDLSQQQQYDELVISKVALRDSEIRYRRLFETAKDGILILDTDSGRITDANPFMSELLGYPHEHFTNKELWEIGLFDDRSANEEAVHELQQHGYIRYEHLPLETSSGQRVEVEIVANSYREDEHSVIQCNIRDITERNLLELERNRLQIQMKEQAAALEDLHRRKDEFLAMLSHELRNPLSPIASALQLLSLQKNEDRMQHQARTIIERQVKQLTRLIDDLLEVSRITTGRIHLQRERVDLSTILTNAVETVRPLLNQRRHRLITTIPLDPIWLNADAARLEQVVVNLLTNAAKYTEDAGKIWLTVEQQSHECVLRVRDTGIGIAAELLPHVFDLFTQAERSLDRSQGGLGIGLALVQRLVQMHDGRVEVTSSLGQGSEFVVHLPLGKKTPPGQSSRETEIEKKSQPSLRVLVVDDNHDAAEMLAMLLVESGHQVRTAHDGPAALLAAIDYLPQVILLDIGLPSMNGYEVAEWLRQHPLLKDVLLVAMTGYGQETDRQKSQKAGFDHHLVKPPDFQILQEIIDSVSEALR